MFAQSLEAYSYVSPDEPITITVSSGNTAPTATPTPTVSNGSGTWKCTQQLAEPEGYQNGRIRLELMQTVNGEPQVSVIVDGEVLEFPYQLDITGVSGVSEGTIYLYEEVGDGDYQLEGQYPVTFEEVDEEFMQGKIIKGIAGFYYVYVNGHGLYECKAKGIFRKNKIKPLVGDDVEIEVLDSDEKEGNVVRIFPRKNSLIRPAVANVDQALVIFAFAQPEPNFLLLDRFLVMMEQQGIPVRICFNKKDLVTEQEADRICKIYSDCGYQVVQSSAILEEGREEIFSF